MAKHAALSPSAAHRWLNCPGSIELAKDLPAPPSSAYAEEGSMAHELAEIKLKVHMGELTKRQAAARTRKIKATEFYCGEMEEATDLYVETVLECMAAAGEDATLMIEQRFDLGDRIPGCFGTADAIVLSYSTIDVIDLKYGKGIRVEAEGNPQMRLYALGAVSLFHGLYEFDTVRTTIVQPRLSHVSTETLSMQALMQWMQIYVKPAAQAAMDGTGELCAGDWCRFCPAKAVCRKRADKNLELARHEFKKAPLLTPEEIGEVLERGEELSKWVADVAAYALEQALAGEHFDGWKLVEGRSNRKYSDDIKVADALKAAGFDEAVLYERKLYGITAMEKIVGKKKLTETLGDLIIKPQGKPTLVPESDKRQAINTTDAAKADFKEE